mmetsp:Transcript_31575/g.79724  ORF Transcript_31575/g.79724 Transcript_31575/m.79724 type:complete len:218 (-) Transcript_31575:416-1069(-)
MVKHRKQALLVGFGQHDGETKQRGALVPILGGILELEALLWGRRTGLEDTVQEATAAIPATTTIVHAACRRACPAAVARTLTPVCRTTPLGGLATSPEACAIAIANACGIRSPAAIALIGVNEDLLLSQRGYIGCMLPVLLEALAAASTAAATAMQMRRRRRCPGAVTSIILALVNGMLPLVTVANCSEMAFVFLLLASGSLVYILLSSVSACNFLL